ncbi:MAG: phosphoadenosine phosphosulfate reductase family protein [Chloroflexi bacterium]|nr:phosphoadenosine phosphosulfate reductase family protein [Chloroflexota bacterium]
MTRPILNHIGISGGKDSTALMLWAVYESGYDRDSIRCTFCDTGNEVPETYAHVQMLADRVHPVETIYPELDFYELARKKGRFPSARARFCTQDLKLKPMKQHVDSLVEQGYDVLLHSGVRRGESAARAALSERGIDSYTFLNVYRPLLDWTIDDVWAIHRRYRIPPNPLYAMGMARVGCAPCIMSRKREIVNIAKRFPDRIDRIRDLEAGGSSFFHANTVPASQRSRTWANKDGKVFQIATIDDVVRWSQTSRGGQQYQLDFDDEAPTCSHESGPSLMRSPGSDCARWSRVG